MLWARSGACALGINVFKEPVPRLVLLIATPGNQLVETVHSGRDSSCSDENPTMIEVPVAAIFRGAPLPAVLAAVSDQPPAIRLNLNTLRQKINRRVQQHNPPAQQ
jgi:hypothetical protein